MMFINNPLQKYLKYRRIEMDNCQKMLMLSSYQGTLCS